MLWSNEDGALVRDPLRRKEMNSRVRQILLSAFAFAVGMLVGIVIADFIVVDGPAESRTCCPDVEGDFGAETWPRCSHVKSVVSLRGRETSERSPALTLVEPTRCSVHDS